MTKPVWKMLRRSSPNPVMDERVLQARLQLVIDSLKATILFNPLSALASALVLGLPHSPFGPVTTARLLAALGGQLFSALVALCIFRRYRIVEIGAARRIESLLLFSQFLFSAVWGAIAFLYWVPGNDVNHVYVVMVMSVVVFAAVSARSMHMPIAATAVLAQCGIYFLRLVSDHSASAHILAPMVPFYMSFLFAMGLAAHKRVDAMIAARFVNEDLAAALTRARDEAIQKRYEAETANASKTAFLANMSHELRTPLNAILGFSDIIAHQSMGRDQIDRYSDYAGDIHASGAHLLSLINDLLDIAKIESGKMEIDPRLLDPHALLDNVSRVMGARASAKGQTLVVEIAGELPPVMADERAFRQVLLNLISNAIKFTPEGGHVALQCRGVDGGGLQVCVSDTGPGIPPEKLERVFEPFSQLDNRFDREAGGTGLGLALVQGLMHLHGGRVWLESTPGHGVRAYLYFPSMPAMAAARRHG